MPNALVDPVVDHDVRHLCFRPYPGHPNGCPNFDTTVRCPPQAPYIEDILDFERPIYAVWNIFDFARHVARMKQRHPNWSERQAACCLYWQGTARAMLAEKLRAFRRDHPGTIVIQTPEALGVNVTATMQSLGVTLEWPPKTITFQVALVGFPLGMKRWKN